MRFVYAISFAPVLALSGAGAQQTEPARRAGAAATTPTTSASTEGAGDGAGGGRNP